MRCLVILGSGRGGQKRYHRLLCLDFRFSEICSSFSFPKQHNALIIGCKAVEPAAQLGPLYKADLTLMTTCLSYKETYSM